MLALRQNLVISDSSDCQYLACFKEQRVLLHFLIPSEDPFDVRLACC
jgi:hypothetical protein